MNDHSELIQDAVVCAPPAAGANDPDILVLGAGLGGLAAALNLSRRGRRVTIVEKESPPWHRVGESFDWETPVLLEELGLNLEELRKQGTLTVKPGVLIWSNTSHRANEAWLLPPPSYMRLLRRNASTYHGNRHRLDQQMLEMVQAEGCHLLTRRIHKIHMRGQAVEKVELEGGEELKARFYIDASGRARVLMRNIGANYTPQGQMMVSLWRRQHHHYDGQGTRLYLVDLGEHMVWVWNIHVADETTDIGMVLPAALYRSMVNGEPQAAGCHNEECSAPKAADGVYWELLRKVELLADLADGSRVAGPLRVCSFQNSFADRAAGDNWLAVGETAFVIDPISSGGVTVALRSAKFAADILDEALSRGEELVPTRNQRFYHGRLLVQVKFINATLADLYHFRKLWNRVGMPVYVRLLVLPQFHINWLGSNFPLRSRRGLALLRVLTAILGRAVRGLLTSLRVVYRTQ
jgi:flavin-dependent dehydrogenase